MGLLYFIKVWPKCHIHFQSIPTTFRKKKKEKIENETTYKEKNREEAQPTFDRSRHSIFNPHSTKNFWQ